MDTTRVTAAYARVSSEEQAREGYSLESQERAARLYCELHGLGEPTLFRESGLSGRETVQRREFQRLMADVRAGRVGHIVVWRLSRLHRNLSQFLSTLAELEAQDVALHSITEHVDTKSATGRLLVNILMAFHAFESEKLAEDVTAGMLQKIRSGGWSNQAPRGYRMENAGLTVDEGKSGVVREAFRRAAEGESLRAVGGDLGMMPATLSYVLANPVYAGFTFEHRRKLPPRPRLVARLAQAEGVYPGNHAPLVEPALWDKVQMVRYRVSRTQEDRSRHIFSGVLRCATCGGPVEVSFSGATRVYRCAHRPRCHSSTAARLELTFLLYLYDLREDPGLVEQIEATLVREQEEADSQVAAPLAEAERELAARMKEKARWRDLYLREKTTEETYLSEAPRLEELRRYWQMRVEVLQSRPLQAADELAAFRERMGTMQTALGVIPSMWDSFTLTEKSLLVHELMEHMEMGKTHLLVKGWSLPAVLLPYAELRGRGPESPASGKDTFDKVRRIKSRRTESYTVLISGRRMEPPRRGERDGSRGKSSRAGR